MSQTELSPPRKTLAVIPARGGSKGIPRKNVLPVAGKPLIVWTIEAARRARQVNRVVVSTDSAEIAEVAAREGADVVWRPAEISGDAASSESALLHVVDYLHASEDYSPDLLVFLQCTSPLTLAEDVDGTIDALLNGQADTAVAVAPFHYFLWRPDESGGASGINHDKRFRPRRQDREAEYLETGAVYVMNTAGFRGAKHRFFGKTALYVMPAERCWEIDEPVDLAVAEVLLRKREASRRLELLPDRLDAIVLDFDGVFTDNRVVVFDDGHEAVLCSRSDGWGLSALRRGGWPILVLSTEANPVVAARCKKLGLECLHGVDDKLPALKQWLSARNFELSRTIFVGNDVNDLECLRAVGCSVAVADAFPLAMQSARVVLESPGGFGALREFAELIATKYERANHA